MTRGRWREGLLDVREREREMIGRTMFTEANNTKMRKKEHDIAPILLTSEQVYQRVQHLNIVFGKTQKKDKSESCIWKKRFIFFDLPY